MKNNQDDKTYYSAQNSSTPKSSYRTGTIQDTYQRTNLVNHDKAHSSGLKENNFDSNNMKKDHNNFGKTPSSHNKLNRNMGEHFLFQNIEYSQSLKSFIYTSNADIKCIKEDNITIATRNSKNYIQNHLNNGNNGKLPIKEDFTNKVNKNSISHMLTSNVKLYKDKTTYCRPVLNYYNQQFIYKTMERNAKLKNLVKKLSIARQREKETVNWNNFINELKNRHRYCHDDALLEEYVTPEIINDCDNNTFSWQKSRLCKNILQDFYGAHDTIQPSSIYEEHHQIPQDIKYLPYYNTNNFCYPTSSMGRLIMLRRGQENYKIIKNRAEQKICNRDENAEASTYKSYVSNPNGMKDVNVKEFKSSLVQVDNEVIIPFTENIKKDKAISIGKVLFSNKSKETNTVDELKDMKLGNINNSSLVNIENKLEYLIESLNSFMVQVKSRKIADRDVKCKTEPYKTAEKINRKLNMTKSNTLDKRENENKVRGEITADSSGSTLSTAYGHQSDVYDCKIDEILRGVETYTEVDFQNQFKNKLKKPCSLQISIEVPTKDCCTEITRSLSKHKALDDEVAIGDIIKPKSPSSQKKMLPMQRMTIAVNTDPLSFLSLLRFSTETLRRLISYMPNFDYLSYLSALSFLQAPRATETSYICKICGAAFDNATKLTEHIHGHGLGKTRDCCVCHHVLERARTNLFSCQYCGQHFTRAYCCELHQQSCAKQLGKCHNAASSLMLLR